MQIAIMFNPGSGTRAARSRLSEVVAAVTARSHRWTIIDCQEQPDFERLLRQQAPDLERIVVIGGDGTLNGAVNAVMGSDNPELPIAFVPTGRGKDTARTLASWSARDMAAGAIARAEVLPTDLVQATLQNGQKRYAINISSIGLGAHAAALANTMPRRLGSLCYVLAAARAFVPLRTFVTKMTIDGAPVVIENALMVAACNGRSFGGGIYIAPEAEADDALLDVVTVSNANLADLALQLGKLKSGTPFEHPALTRWQASSVEIEPVASNHFEADGEELKSQPIRYEIAPGRLNWITP